MAGWVHVVGFLAGDADMSDVPLKVLFKAAMVRGILIGSRTQYVAHSDVSESHAEVAVLGSRT